jgi:hypothetical protein
MFQRPTQRRTPLREFYPFEGTSLVWIEYYLLPLHFKVSNLLFRKELQQLSSSSGEFGRLKILPRISVSGTSKFVCL